MRLIKPICTQRKCSETSLGKKIDVVPAKKVFYTQVKSALIAVDIHGYQHAANERNHRDTD